MDSWQGKQAQATLLRYGCAVKGRIGMTFSCVWMRMSQLVHEAPTLAVQGEPGAFFRAGICMMPFEAHQLWKESTHRISLQPGPAIPPAHG